MYAQVADPSYDIMAQLGTQPGLPTTAGLSSGGADDMPPTPAGMFGGGGADDMPPAPVGMFGGGGADEAVMLDFIRSCLQFDRDSRPSAVQLLQHAWLKSARAAYSEAHVQTLAMIAAGS